MAPSLQIRQLQEADLPAALYLSGQVGWNQTRTDWLRLLKLLPAGCLAGQIDGQLVATATIAEYPRNIAWIGMVIVDEAYRGMGIGQKILQATLQRAHVGEGGTVVGLDATQFGHPVYRKHGFVDICPIDSWIGRLCPAGIPRGVAPGDASSLEKVIAYDREACGIDRGDLLRELAGEPGNAWWMAVRRDKIVGHAFLRPGRQYQRLGPSCADEETDFSALLDAAAQMTAGEPLLLDAVRCHEGTRILQSRGMTINRTLTRMTHPRPENLFMGKRVQLITAFEWG